MEKPVYPLSISSIRLAEESSHFTFYRKSTFDTISIERLLQITQNHSKKRILLIQTKNFKSNDLWIFFRHEKNFQVIEKKLYW